MNGEKEKIFKRIREALTMPAPHPGHHGAPPGPPISEEAEGRSGGRRAGEPRLASAPPPGPPISEEEEGRSGGRRAGEPRLASAPPSGPPISEEEEGRSGGRRAGEPRLASAPPPPSDLSAPSHDTPHPVHLGPEGLPEISRGWSEAEPPDSRETRISPGGAAEPSSKPHSESPQEEISHWLPPVGTTFHAQADLFTRNSVQLKSTFHLLENETAAARALAELALTEGWQRIAAHGDGANGPSTRAMVSALGLPGLWTDSGYDVRAMESCDAGITECDALIAQTGSVLVTARSAGGRALSVLPPHHVVLARRDQLVADLPAAFALLEQKYARNYPSFIGFITGPSRTGDIERILVLGAHGPKKLTIFCW